MVTPNIHLIFYGNWNQAPDNANGGKQIVIDFMTNLPGAGFLEILTAQTTPNFNAYTSTTQTCTNLLGTINQQDVGFNPKIKNPTNLADNDIVTIVNYYVNTFQAHVFDVNAIYFVLTSSGVTQTSKGAGSQGFCTQYCAWHSYYVSTTKQNIKYGWIGNPATKCPGSCAPQAIGPNGNTGADAAVNVLGHELLETISDPDINAWYDSRGQENSDKCAWTFGDAQFAVSAFPGAFANLVVGARNFMVQRVLATNSKCYINGVSGQQ